MAADSATATASTHPAGALAAARATRATPAGGHGSPRLTGWWPRTRYRASLADTAMPHSMATANPAAPSRCSCADHAAKAGMAPKFTVSARLSKPWPNADSVPVRRATAPSTQSAAMAAPISAAASHRGAWETTASPAASPAPSPASVIQLAGERTCGRKDTAGSAAVRGGATLTGGPPLW
jgi:hypothetical protein